MIVAHHVFRRDLRGWRGEPRRPICPTRPGAQSVVPGDCSTRAAPARRAEDELIRRAAPRLVHSEAALSVLDAMEEEHERIDPLLAAVDAAFAQHDADGAVHDDWPGEDRLADVIDVLASTLTDHSARGARRLVADRRGPDQLRWRRLGFKVRVRTACPAGARCSPGSWTARPGGSRRHLGPAPAASAPALRAVWKPRFAKTPRS